MFLVTTSVSVKKLLIEEKLAPVFVKAVVLKKGIQNSKTQYRMNNEKCARHHPIMTVMVTFQVMGPTLRILNFNHEARTSITKEHKKQHQSQGLISSIVIFSSSIVIFSSSIVILLTSIHFFGAVHYDEFRRSQIVHIDRKQNHNITKVTIDDRVGVPLDSIYAVVL